MSLDGPAESQPKEESALRDRRVGQTVCVAAFAVAGAALFAVGGPWALNQVYSAVSKSPANRPWEPNSLLTIIPQLLLGAFVGAALGRQCWNGGAALGRRWERMDLADRVTFFLGVFGGLLATIPILLLFYALQLPAIYLPLLILGFTLGFSTLAVYGLHSMQDVLPWYRNRPATKRSGIKILDTNVIIDGRIYDVARSGFLEGEIYVPQFVIEELQHIADHHDALRRARGRRGLEMLRLFQAEFPMEIGKYDRFANIPNEEVDHRLLRIAKAIGADIVTNDWNLNSVAKLQNVKILSLNELALNLRPNLLPNEALLLLIAREGSQPGQGVGYLDDGTMVVVEHGKPFVGETIRVTVTQVIQTERGKMIFAEVDDEEQDDAEARRARRR